MTIGNQIKEIVNDMDKAIHRYQERNHILEVECQFENGKLRDSRRAFEFESRRKHVWNDYDKECTILRRRFRDVVSAAKAAKTNNDYMPQEIIIGKGELSYTGLKEAMPLMANFPLIKPLWASDECRSDIVRMMLKLLVSLPLGKCEFYVYDPEHYGASIEYFDQLLKMSQVFPAKKVFVAGELSVMLDEIQSYMASLNQDRFPGKKCKTWREYNNLLKQNKEPIKKIIPYKVLVLFGIPSNYEKGDLERIFNIATEGHKCGIMTLLSLHQSELNDRNSLTEGIIRQIQDVSTSLDSDEICEWNLQHLHISRIRAIKSPENEFKAKKRIAKQKDMLENDKSGIVTMDELLREDDLFNEKAIDGIDIPLGTNVDDGELQYLKLGDDTAHFLVGGATGSGKSNLVHDIILNACWRYSPTEVNFVLLDYKSGVEFSKYAPLNDSVLPNAELVAKNADVGYGLTVLQHLCDELENRNCIFKAVGKSDYASYRRSYPNEILPRIVLIIDEFQTIFQNAIDGASLERSMQTLSKKGRSAGIHMIFATQTLKALSEFGQVATQFTGRVALKCSSEDSNTLLSYDNDAAAELVRPYAILNVQSGRKDYNQKFAVPLVEDGRIENVIQLLYEQINQRGVQCANRKVFDGEKCPVIPQSFKPDGVSFHLGQCTDYDEREFRLDLEQTPENNVLVIGERGLLMESIIMNAQACEEIDEIDYIGNKLNIVPTGCDKFNNFENFTEYFSGEIATKDDLLRKRRIIIVDGVKISKRPADGDLSSKKSWEEKANILPELCEQGSHIVAFFATYRDFKRRWQDLEMRNIFGITIGYCIAPQEWQNLTDDPKISNKLSKLEPTKSRATCIYNGAVTHFRPFVGGRDE